MSQHQSIEVDGDLVGILTFDAKRRSFQFHSGVAPYELLDGSRFSRVAEAQAAVARMRRVARPIQDRGRAQDRAIEHALLVAQMHL